MEIKVFRGSLLDFDTITFDELAYYSQHKDYTVTVIGCYNPECNEIKKTLYVRIERKV